MGLTPESLRSLLAGLTAPLGIALAGVIVLVVAIKLRRIAQAARIALGMTAQPAGPERQHRARVGRSEVAARAALILGAVFLAAATLFLSLRLIPEAFQYAEMMRNLPRAAQLVRVATWRDAKLRCAANEPLGIHLQRLFRRPEIFLLRIQWDSIPPRYEVLILGRTHLAEGAVDRRLELLVDLGLNGQAELRGAELLGDAQALEPARRLLAAACARSLRE